MKYLITGSIAAYHWFPDFRKPSDIDLLTSAKITCKTDNIDACVIDASHHEAADAIFAANKDPVFLDADLLYTLKCSHAAWDIKWEKTMFDIVFFKQKGCKLNREIFDKLIPVWEKIHGKKKVNLNQTLEYFFTEHVQRRYPHEWLHEQLAFNGQPMHTRIRKDLTKALCSKSMFESLSDEEKLETALEEILVLAVERFDLTVDSSIVDRRVAIGKSYKNLITSQTKGWFCLFLIENQKELLFDCKSKYLNHLNSALRKIKDSDGI